MFKDFWKDDYEYNTSGKLYVAGRNIIYYLMVAFVLLFNYCLSSSPVNAYNDGVSSFEIENFVDYKDVESCNYSLTAFSSDGTVTDSGITMSCYTLNNAETKYETYDYVKTSNKVYETKYLSWVNDEDLSTDDIFVYNESVIGSNLLKLQDYQKETGETIQVYSPSTTDYLQTTGQSWDYYKVLKYIPSWVSDSKSIYNLSSYGSVYYDTGKEANNGYDSYYKYDREDGNTYNKYYQLKSIDVEYLYSDGNDIYQYGDISNIDGYFQDIVKLENVKQTYYKLQHYEPTYQATDINGKTYGQSGFSSKSYYKDGIFYLWEGSENKFYAYEIDTATALGYISDSEVKTYMTNGKTTINKDSSNNLISYVKKYRQYYETTYSLTSTQNSTTGTSYESSKVSTSTDNSYTYYTFSSSPVSYDYTYKYKWTYVSDYLYEYKTDYVQQNYSFEIVDQEAILTHTEVTTYGFSSDGSETKTGSKPSDTSYSQLCSSVTQLTGTGIKCYTKANTNYYDWTLSSVSKKYYSSNSDYAAFANAAYSESKTVYLNGSTSTTIYKSNKDIGSAISTGDWYYSPGSATKYIKYRQPTTYTVSTSNTTETGSTSTSPGETYNGTSWSTKASALSGLTYNSNNKYTYKVYTGKSSAYNGSKNYSNYYLRDYKYLSNKETVTKWDYDGTYTTTTVDNGLKDTASGSSFYTDKTSIGYKYDWTYRSSPYILFLKVYNKAEGYSYWAAFTASFTNTYTAVSKNSTATEYKSSCSHASCITQNTIYDYAIWYKIDSSIYSSRNFDPSNYTRSSIPEKSANKTGAVLGIGGTYKYNHVVDYHFNYSAFNYNSSYVTRSIYTQGSYYTTLYFGVETLSKTTVDLRDTFGVEFESDEQYDYNYVSFNTNIARQNTGMTANKTTYKNYSSYIEMTNSYRNYQYYKYTVGNVTTSKGNTENYDSSRYTSQCSVNTFAGSGTGTSGRVYYTNCDKYTAFNGTYVQLYDHYYTTYTVTKAVGTNTSQGVYYISNNTGIFYNSDGSYKGTSHGVSSSATYSSCTSTQVAGNGCVQTTYKVTSVNGGTVSYYRKIDETEKTVNFSFTKYLQSDAITAIKKKEGVFNAVASGSNKIVITYDDNSTTTITGNRYYTFTKYSSVVKVATKTTDVKSSFTDISGTKKTENLAYHPAGNYPKTKGAVGYNKTDGTAGVTNALEDDIVPSGSGTSLTTVVTKTTQTPYTRTKYTYKGLIDTSTTVTLHNSSSNASLASTYTFSYKGKNGSLSGADTTLTICTENVSGATSGKCYKFVSTTFVKQLSENVTEYDAADADYNQKVDTDYSKTAQSSISNSTDKANVTAYYKHTNSSGAYIHLPSEGNQRICTSSTDTLCYRDNPEITVSRKPVYSYTKYVITYSQSSKKGTTAIKYGNGTTNSNTNTYQEFGKLTGATYLNDGSVTGGTYTKTSTSGGISSKNLFNQNDWFLKATNSSGLVKSYNTSSKVFTYTGSGTITYTVTGLTQGTKYYLSFNALSSNKGTLNIKVNGTSLGTVTLGTAYPSTRYSYSFTATGTSVPIVFTISNGMDIKEISLSSSGSTYTEYVTHTLDAVTNTFYQTYTINETYTYYDVTNSSDANGYSISNQSNVIGYNNVINNADGWEKGLLEKNETAAINTNYVLYGKDFNNDGTIANNEKYTGSEGAKSSICLDSECHYRYIIDSSKTPKSFNYTRTRYINVEWNTTYNWFATGNVLAIDSSSITNLNGSDTPTEYDIKTSDFDKTKYVWLNDGTNNFYSISTNFGKYKLFMEYLNRYKDDENPDNYKFNSSTQQIYYNGDKTNYYKYAISHDENKLYNSVTKVYDKLDKGYTEVQVYNNENTLLTMVNSLINSGYSYLKSENVVYLYDDTPKLSQDRLYELYVANNSSVSYSCKDTTSEITTANCTFTYSANGGVEPLTKDDLVNNKVVASDKFGIIISNYAFEDVNEYFRYNNFNYKFIIDDSKQSYLEFDRYLFGGHWEEEAVNQVFAANSGDYAILNGLYSDSSLTFYKFKNFDNYYTKDTKLYILRNNSGSIRNDNTYNNSTSDKYFYAWISGNLEDSDYSTYDYVTSYDINEVYNSLISVDIGDYKLSSHYLVVNSGGTEIRMALKNMLGTINSPLAVYKLTEQSDDIIINNILLTTDLEELDLSKAIDVDELSASNTSYALKFSGMYNYWESTINGSTILSMTYAESDKKIDENGNESDSDETAVEVETCTLSALKIQQKDSTIKFGEEEISEFILLNRGSKEIQQNYSRNQTVYDLYALYQVKDGENYYKVSDEIDNLLEALKILKTYHYTGYLFSALPVVNEDLGITSDKISELISEAEIQLFELESNSIIEWSRLAYEPELISEWFGGSTYANIIYTDESMNPTTYDATTAFTSTYKEYYQKYFLPLYSYLLFGHVESNYRSNVSYPHLNNLTTQVTFTEQIFNRRFDGTILNDDDSGYAIYVEEIVEYFNTLSTNAYKYDSSITQLDFEAGTNKTNGDWTKMKIEYSQALGIILDMYMHIDEYKYPELHVWNNNEVETKEKLISMIPAINYSSSFESVALLQTLFDSSDNEYYFTNFIDYVNNNGKSEFVFVRSSTYTDRYYIYKLLESSDDSFSAISTIRQTSTTKQNYAQYNDYNNIVTLNIDNEYATLHKTLYDSVKQLIADADFGDWLVSALTVNGFSSGDKDDGNALYYMVYEDIIDGFYETSMINHLGSYIYTSESLNKKRPLINRYSSYISQNPDTTFKYVGIDEDDIELNSVLNQANAKASAIDKLNQMANSREKVEYGGFDYVLNTMINNFTAKLITYNNEGTLVSSGRVESYYFDVYLENELMPNGSRCYNDWCVGTTLPFEFEIVVDETEMRSYYFYYLDPYWAVVFKYPVVKLYSDVRMDFAIKTSYVFGDTIYQNGHSLIETKYSDTNANETILSEVESSAIVSTDIVEDNNYNIGETDFNISINDISLNNDLFDTTSLYEYSLSYKPLTTICYDGFEYDNITGLCYYISNNEGSLKLLEDKYTHTYTIDYEYIDNCDGCNSDDPDIYTGVDETIVINSRKGSLTETEIINLIENTYPNYVYSYIEDIKHVSTEYIPDIWNVTGSQYKYDVEISYSGYKKERKCVTMVSTEGDSQIICNTVDTPTTVIEKIEVYSDNALDSTGVENAVKNLPKYASKSNLTVRNYTTDTTSSASTNIYGLPAATEFTLKTRKRFTSGYLSKEYIYTFTTSHDMVSNPYDDTLSDITPLTMTQEQIDAGYINGDVLLKSEYIPLDLQKCLFSYDFTSGPTSEGVSVCGKYVVSNKYRLQLTATETIKIAFQLVDSEGDSLLKDLAGHKLYFVNSIDAQTKEYHMEGNSQYSIVANGDINDLGVFYYSFNETDLKEYAKYSNVESFVNNYIFKKYTIGIDENLYSQLRKKYKNETFNIIVTEFYDDRFTYMDYNQNGKMDETTLDLNKMFLSKNGYQTYYENVDKEFYCAAALKIDINSNFAWSSTALIVGDAMYREFKTGLYTKYNTTSYYIFAYDPENGAHIVK